MICPRISPLASAQQFLDDVLHALEIKTRAIIEVLGTSWSESYSWDQMLCHGSGLVR
jgi:hypothetical protein